MEASASGPSINLPTPTGRPTQRLLFDKRYGWIFDEWKDPSEQALAGGRGMFCILPIAKSLLKIASQSINVAAGSVISALENPKELSPQALHTNLCTQFQKLGHSIQRPNLKLITFCRDSPMDSTQAM
ncbi:uncharacterized protein LOC103719485 [Phoenix dactylifera]|uniref:Uncharacterized protein LOC103719485 n=1 Tax=Phoenix dactylifera TaxID=42345 RepID=A0A8B9AUE7_PHODC|nr:uncharacterized protein LOC103719485 [Phoenix dactylifera]